MSLPSNIRSWMKQNATAEQQKAANKIGNWCDKLGHRVTNGTAIGKNYSTLILDLTYHGSEIYIHENGFDKTDGGFPGVTINDVEIPDGSSASFKKFAEQVDEIFNKKTASWNAASLKNMAARDVKMLGDDKEWLKHIWKEYNSFKILEGTELSKREFEIYQKECLRLLKEKRASVNARVAKELVKIARELVAIRKPKYYHSQWASMVLKAYSEGKLDNDNEIRKWVSYQNGGAAVDSLTQEVKDILAYYAKTGIEP